MSALELETKTALDQLLGDVERFIRLYVVFPDEHQPVAVTLWVAHTYCWQAADTTPYLAITAPEKQSGKTRLLEVLERLVNSPMQTANISEAAAYRVIENDSPTLLFDEVDAVFGGKSERAEALRGIINAGHRRGGAAIRMVNMTTVGTFNVFCPKALAGIGNLPDTIADRSIGIRLQRRLSTEPVESFRRRKVEPKALVLRNRLKANLDEVIEHLTGAEPHTPEQLSDREADGWEPLFAIADLAGGDWSERAREAAIGLSGTQPSDESARIRLLSDIRLAFDTLRFERISSETLINWLTQLDDAPWGNWFGKPLTTHGVHRMVCEQYGIAKARTVRFDNNVSKKGWYRSDFELAWSRYLQPTQ